MKSVGLTGRVEINLFLPMLDGRYRRALSSMAGRAREAPRWFTPRHDSQTIPEVELALTVGEALRRSRREVDRATPPAGEPPFADWYHSLVSVPYFDYAGRRDSGGGDAAGVVEDASLAETATQSPTMAALRSLMREAITGTLHLLRSAGSGRIMDDRMSAGTFIIYTDLGNGITHDDAVRLHRRRLGGSAPLARVREAAHQSVLAQEARFVPLILGAHESVAGGLATVFERAARDGCDAVQLWTRSSRQWAAKPLDEPTVAAFKSGHRAARGATTGKKLPLAAHASYLINLAAASAIVWERSTETLYDECVRAEALGVAQVIVHPGAAVGCSTADGDRSRGAGAARHLPRARRAPQGAPAARDHRRAGLVRRLQLRASWPRC